MPNAVLAIGSGGVEHRLNHLARSTQPTPQSVIIELGTKNFVLQPKFLISQLNRKSFSILIQNLGEHLLKKAFFTKRAVGNFSQHY
ncbi:MULTISPECIES: hypothetical protein [unclassified Microcoleus]|uniref:hypothetical protein n=1 Tax=unclassified Microcoleus TaxID=2642155 RepID=UPI002FCF9816